MNGRDVIAAGSLVMHDALGPGFVDAGAFRIAFRIEPGRGPFESLAEAADGGILVTFFNVRTPVFDDFTPPRSAAAYHLLVAIQPVGTGPFADDLSFTLLGN